MSQRPVILGLLGGIASGKSTVARMLGERGAKVVDADAIAHEVLAGDDVRDGLLALFGPEAFDTAGRPDRARIAAAAFADPARLRGLERIVHPRVRERIREAVAAAGTAPVVVIDAPLLYEGGLAAEADVLVFVAAGADSRRERAERDRGWAPDDLPRREARQAGLSEKERAAWRVLSNDGSLVELEAEVDALWDNLVPARAGKGQRQA